MSPDAAVVPEDRHGRILAELAGMGLELARDLRERALAAETAEEATRLARAFQSISRGVRQTLALELKVARFRKELDRELEQARAAEAQAEAKAAQAEASARAAAIRRRRNAVAGQVETLIYCEEENEDLDDAAFDAKATRLQHRLGEWLDAEAQAPDFTTAEMAWQVIDACEALGLDPHRLYDFDDDDDETAAPAPEPESGPEGEPEPAPKPAPKPAPEPERAGPVHIESG